MGLVRPDPRKANDGGAAALVQFVKNAIVFGDDLLQHLRRDRDFIVGIGGPDKNHLPADFNVRRFLSKVAVHAVSPLLPHVPEQLEIRENPENKSKPLTGLTVPFLSTALNLRQAAGTVSNRAAVDLPTQVAA
jgi:hypothetical protein